MATGKARNPSTLAVESPSPFLYRCLMQLVDVECVPSTLAAVFFSSPLRLHSPLCPPLRPLRVWLHTRQIRTGRQKGGVKKPLIIIYFSEAASHGVPRFFFFYRQTHSALFRPQHALSFKAFTRVLRPLIRFSSSHKAARNAIDPRLVASSVNHGGAGEVNRSCPVLKHCIETLTQVLHSDEWAE